MLNNFKNKKIFPIMNLNIDNSPNLNLNSPFAIINSDRSMTKEPKNFLKKVPKEHLISFFL